MCALFPEGWAPTEKAPWTPTGMGRTTQGKMSKMQGKLEGKPTGKTQGSNNIQGIPTPGGPPLPETDWFWASV